MKMLALIDGIAAAVWGQDLEAATRRTRAACAASLAARERFVASGSHQDCITYAIRLAIADDAMIAEARLRKMASAHRLGIERACSTVDRVACNG